MARYPSRRYVSPRTRHLRRIYFTAAAGAIILIAIITLYSLSEKESVVSQDSSAGQPRYDNIGDDTSPSKSLPDKQEVPEQPPETEQSTRFTMPLEVDSPSETEPAGNKPIESATKTATEAPSVQEPKQRAEEITAGDVTGEPSTADERASRVIGEAMELLQARPVEIIKAREMLNELLGTDISEQNRGIIKRKLSELADKWLFSELVYPGDSLCSMYRVESGDLLSTIGNEYKVPWQILLRINDISRPEHLRAGQNIKVINGPFHAKVYRSSFTMDLYLRDTFVRSFSVGLGREGHETPTGLWLVEPGGKLIKPRWTDPDTGRTYEPDDPDYPLGSRWIGLEGLEGAAKGRTGFAIHGTKDPNEIGTAKSRGCIRLYNGDAKLIYDLLMAGESKVLVTD